MSIALCKDCCHCSYGSFDRTDKNMGMIRENLDSRNMNSKFLCTLTVTCYCCVCEDVDIRMETVVATTLQGWKLSPISCSMELHILLNHPAAFAHKPADMHISLLTATLLLSLSSCWLWSLNVFGRYHC